MYFVLLAVLNRGPAHGVDWRHNTSIISEDLDVLRLESFLDQELNPVEMNGGRIDGVVMMNARETKLNVFFYQHRTFRSRFRLTRWSGVRRVMSTIGRKYRKCSPIVRRSGGRVRRGVAGGFVMVGDNQYNPTGKLVRKNASIAYGLRRKKNSLYCSMKKIHCPVCGPSSAQLICTGMSETNGARTQTRTQPRTKTDAHGNSTKQETQPVG